MTVVAIAATIINIMLFDRFIEIIVNFFCFKFFLLVFVSQLRSIVNIRGNTTKLLEINSNENEKKIRLTFGKCQYQLKKMEIINSFLFDKGKKFYTFVLSELVSVVHAYARANVNKSACKWFVAYIITSMYA